MQLPDSYVERIRSSIEMLCDRSALLVASQVPSWCEGSIRVRDSQDSLTSGPIEDAGGTGTLLLTHSLDHLAAFRQLLNPNDAVCSVAIYTCARGVLETAAISKWLVDPHIDRQERVRRVFALRVDSLIEQRKAGNANGDSGLVDKANARIAKVLEDAKTLGVPTTEKNVVGGKPGATAMIKHCLDMEMLYRMLSALSHGQHWAIRGLSLQEAGPEDIPLGAKTNGKYFQPVVKMNYLAVIANETISATCIALNANAIFNGWNKVPFTKLFEDVFDRLNLRMPSGIWQDP